MEGFFLVGILSLLLNFSRALPVEKEIHKYMTENEQLYILNAKPGVIPEYELTPIQLIENPRPKRGISTSKHLKLKVGGEDYELSLEENDHVLYGSNTPIYLATGDYETGMKHVSYQKRPFPLPTNMKLYHDRSKRAAVTIHDDDDGEIQINGIIGDEYIMRSLPVGIRRWIPKFNNHHVILKLPRGMNVKPSEKVNYVNHGDDETIDRFSMGIEPAPERIVELKFLGRKILYDVNKFLNSLKVGNMPYIEINGVLKQATDILQAMISQGYLKPEEIKNFPIISFPSGRKTIIEVNSFKQSLLNNAPLVYTSSDRIEQMSPSYVLEELKKQGIVLPDPKGDTVYPELLITMDFETVKRFNGNIQDITKYMVAYWNAVDLRFRELEDPKIRINIAGIVIPQNQEGAVLDHLHHHRQINGILGRHFTADQDTFPFDTYDIVVGFFNLFVLPGSNNIVGQANALSACANKRGLSVEAIADVGNFGSVEVATHELGHSLGAQKHDNNCTSGDNIGYIMEEQSVLEVNNDRVFHWSTCSKSQLAQYLRSIQATCLYNKPEVGTPYAKLLPGRLMNRDEQCQNSILMTGSVSSEIHSHDCLNLWCVFKNKEPNSIGSPAEGTSCGSKQICMGGKCVHDPEKNTV